MTMQHQLSSLFHPASIAVLGASERVGSVGHKVMTNLIRNQFQGNLFPVNPKHRTVLKYPCYPSVADIDQKVDLAIITTPAVSVPALLQQCGECGIQSVIIISAGFSEMGETGKALEKSMLEIAKKYHIRFVGPNCLGVMRPSAHLNATFDNNQALPGKIALVSQSGAICAAILDWALERQIGFSAIVSMGNSSDLDFGDMLDYLALDSETSSILLYIEGIHHSQRFLSGLRAASRLKPVIAIKAGRQAGGVRAAQSHTGALVGDDDVFSAALTRGGAVRVFSIEQLFTAAQILASPYRVQGDRLAIITNGGGAGVMAADHAADLRMPLPLPSAETMTQLNALLPVHWSHQNPIDILGDATPERYRRVIDTVLRDDQHDALLITLVPVAMSQPVEVAKEVCSIAQGSTKPIIACWMGERQSKAAWKIFEEKHIPCYSTPEVAVEAISYLAKYALSQQFLLQTPQPLVDASPADLSSAKSIIQNVIQQKRNTLTTIESKAVLSAFGVPVSQVVEAHDAEEACIFAETIGFPLVMKISSPDISHKQDVGGVRIGISSATEAQMVFSEMWEKVKANSPTAKINGITLERMYTSSNYRELMVGVIRDRVFGPVISVGIGGSLVEIIRDRSIGLPPLNTLLAREMISQSRASNMLGEFRGRPAVKMDALIHVLLAVSDLVGELPELCELDINPLLIDEHGAIAVDARIVVRAAPKDAPRYSHVAISPYPKQWTRTWSTAEGEVVTVRPVRPEDAIAEADFMGNLAPSADYFNFLRENSHIDPTNLIRFTQIDYATEMTLVATVRQQREVMIGVARYQRLADEVSAQFALAVSVDWQNKGVASHLLTSLLAIAKAQGISLIRGVVSKEQHAMLELAERAGFKRQSSAEPDKITLIKQLNEL